MANLTDADKVLRNDTGKDIASKLDAIKSAIQNQSTTLNNLSDVSILSVQDGQFLKYNSIEQKWENVSLPDPMVFKGTLGTSGTITALPVDGSANVGDTYKVIEDGTYATVSAKVGDLFSCLTKTSVANTWVLIPSGDESFTDTWRGIKVNGTEKLASSITSGEVDFVEGSNVQITFDTTGNKIIISATDTTYSEATQSTSGLMSASDKTKLDTIPITADTQPITSGSAVNTKEYIDDKTTLVKSASGSLIHITDGGDNIPLKSLTSEIVAVESGSGEKSPTNPYTISGFSQGVITVTDNDQITNTYTFTFGQTVYGGHFDNKGNLVVTHKSLKVKDTNWYLGSGGATVRFYSSTVSDILAPDTTTSAMPSIIAEDYATVAYFNRIFYENFSIAINTNKAINITDNNYTTASDFKTAMGECLIVYPLETPITLSITSQDIHTLSGVNNIFSNCGDTAIEYFTSSADGIAELIKASTWTEITGTLTAGNTSITLSSGDITSNSTINVFTDGGVDYTSITVANGSVTLTFEESSSDLGVKVRVS